MTDSTTLHNVESTGINGLGSITRTRSGAVFGPIKPRAFLVDPSFTGDDYVRNRAQRQSRALLRSGSTIQLGEFDNNAPAFDLQNAMGLNPVQKGGLNPNSWSVFTVVEGLVQNPITQRSYITMTDEERDDGIAPMCSLVARDHVGPGELSTIVMYEHSIRDAGQPQRVAASADLTNTGPNLIVWTFSVKNGCAIYLNGIRVGENKDDKRPLTYGYTANELSLLFGSRGKYGITAGVNLDLNDVSNMGSLRAIEEFYAWEYDIASLKSKYPEEPVYF